MHIMLDLETMGTDSHAPIIAIGAVAFDESGIGQPFYSQVNLTSSVDSKSQISADTVMWWMQQSDQAREAFVNNSNAPHINRALIEFSNFCTFSDVSTMWGNGASFDNVVLTNAYSRNVIVPPWKFWQDRCYRTVKNMFPDIPMVRSGTHHNALDDARTQAEHLIAICKRHSFTLN